MTRTNTATRYVWILALVVTGCTASSPRCVLDTDCVGAMCLDGACVPVECEANADCLDDRVCNERGACVGCFEDAECDAGFSCDRTRCVSSAGVGCFEDEDCPSPTICRARRCVPLCEDGTECSSGVCTDGACDACGADTDCGEGVCEASTCRRSCEADTECRPEQRCLRGRCAAACDGYDSCWEVLGPILADEFDAESLRTLPRYAAAGCQLSGEAFVAGVCDGADPYEGPRLCDPCLASVGGCLGACEGGDCLCEQTDDCPAGRVCVEGTCAPCQTSDECGCGQFCSYGLCRDACADDSACAPGFQCIQGQCNECGGELSCRVGGCYQDGCVSPCIDGDDCSPAGRSSVCETFELFDEVRPRECE
ncbi:MAG: hypothetical protein ACI9KE_004496 [Polyangiales bacterium]|jgi:hypothetical protein